MLTRQQVVEIETKATKIQIFSADYQKYELWESGQVLALCATARELRKLLALAMGGYTACTTSVYNDLCDCSFCTLARRVKEAQC